LFEIVFAGKILNSTFGVRRWTFVFIRSTFTREMKVILLNTGTELLLGDVQDAHLAFIAREIFPLGLRVGEQRTVSDGPAIRDALSEVFPRADLVFVTGGLGPTTDDITRDIAAELLGLNLVFDERIMASISERFTKRGIKFTERVSRQAYVPEGAAVFLNENGTAPGLYLRANISPSIESPHLFLLPGPPRELQPMFRQSVTPVLRPLALNPPSFDRRMYKIANMGESLVEAAIGQKILAIPGIELGYCARPGEVDVRIVGESSAIQKADFVVRSSLGSAIFSMNDELLEEVVVKLLTGRKETLALAESCTGGLLADRITNVPGASEVFLAGYVSYANEAKIDIVQVDPALIEQHGAVSEPVARAMAEGARTRAKTTYALATTGIAGPTGGSSEKPIGTVFVALAAPNAATTVQQFFFPTDRQTFKQLVAQAAFDLLRRKLTG
jgi:competence/damage-inducible protein CinA-like protein